MHARAREHGARARALVHGRLGRVCTPAHGRKGRACALSCARPFQTRMRSCALASSKYLPIFIKGPELCSYMLRLFLTNGAKQLISPFCSFLQFSFQPPLSWRLSPLHAWRPGCGALLLLFSLEQMNLERFTYDNNLMILCRKSRRQLLGRKLT